MHHDRYLLKSFSSIYKLPVNCLLYHRYKCLSACVDIFLWCAYSIAAFAFTLLSVYSSMENDKIISIYNDQASHSITSTSSLNWLERIYIYIYILHVYIAVFYALMPMENMPELFIHSSWLFILSTRIRRNDCIISTRE